MTATTLPQRTAAWTERAATSAVFLVLGIGFGAWAAALPGIKADLGLSDREISLALLALAAASTVMTLSAGWITPRLGTGRATIEQRRRYTRSERAGHRIARRERPHGQGPQPRRGGRARASSRKATAKATRHLAGVSRAIGSRRKRHKHLAFGDSMVAQPAVGMAPYKKRFQTRGRGGVRPRGVLRLGTDRQALL